MKKKHGKSEGYFIFHDTLYINDYHNDLRKIIKLINHDDAHILNSMPIQYLLIK